MKTVITSTGNNGSSFFDMRFGRAAWFCVYDESSKEVTFVENKGVGASNGAGTKAAETMAELGVDKVISGDFGPKAKELLDKLNIQMVVINDADEMIDEIISKINQ